MRRTRFLIPSLLLLSCAPVPEPPPEEPVKPDELVIEKPSPAPEQPVEKAEKPQ